MSSSSADNPPRIYLGYNLSYANERVWEATPGECAGIKEAGLYVCLILPGSK